MAILFAALASIFAFVAIIPIVVFCFGKDPAAEVPPRIFSDASLGAPLPPNSFLYSSIAAQN